MDGGLILITGTIIIHWEILFQKSPWTCIYILQATTKKIMIKRTLILRECFFLWIRHLTIHYLLYLLCTKHKQPTGNMLSMSQLPDYRCEFDRNWIKLMKRKSLMKHSLHEKTAASVLLKLFISRNEWCHTTDPPSAWAELHFQM